MRVGLAFTVAVVAVLVTVHAQARQDVGEIRGSITAADGTALSNTTIEIRKLARQAPVRTQSGADGRFRVQGLSDGVYRVIASRQGWKTETEEAIRVHPGSYVAVNLSLEPATACPLSPAGYGRLVGTVRDSNGLTSPARISLNNVDAGYMRSTSAGIDGRYELDALPAGRYKLRVNIPGFDASESDVSITPDEAVTKDVQLAVIARIVKAKVEPLPSPPRLTVGTGGVTGRITDSGGGVIPGATVTLIGAGESWREITDARGLYAFANRTPGTYQLRVELSGFATNTRSMFIRPNTWSNGSAVLEIGALMRHPLEMELRVGEVPVQITTSLGALVLAVRRGTSFLACADKRAYDGGTLERIPSTVFAASASLESRLLRLNAHPQRNPVPGSPEFALLFEGSLQLVAIGPADRDAGTVIGRLLHGADIIEKMRSMIDAPGGTGPAITVRSVSRVFLL